MKRSPNYSTLRIRGLSYYFSIMLILHALLGGAVVLPSARSNEPLVQSSFRVRLDFDEALNADQGWAGKLNEDVPIIADQPFRLRFELALPYSVQDPASLGLQYRRNQSPWQDVGAYDFPNPSAKLALDLERFQIEPLLGSSDDKAGKRQLKVFDGTPQRVLRAEAQETSPLILYPQMADLSEIEFEGEIRLPESNGDGVAVVVGYSSAEMHYEVVFDAKDGTVEILRVQVDSDPIVLMEQAIEVGAGRWFPFAVEFEDEQMTVAIEDREFELQLEGADLLWNSRIGFRLPAWQSAEFRGLLLRGRPKTPRVSIVSCPAFADQSPTKDLLEDSMTDFRPGFGMSLSTHTQPLQTLGGHSEVEWPLVIRRYADGPIVNEAGDVFEFRMVATDGRPLNAEQIPQLRLTVAAGHLGGTYVETPGRIGPWQASNGDLYFIMEPTETDNVFMMVKSTDDGATWQEVDGMHRPVADDLEGVDARQVGDTIHILHQVTSAVWYHTFHTSDHPMQADRWGLRDELVGRVEARAQAAALVIRSDGSRAAFFVGEDKVHYSLGSKAGVWSEPKAIDPDVWPQTAGPQAVLGANDVVHLAYYGLDGTLWYRRLESSGELSERQLIAEGVGKSRSEFGSVLPLSFLPESNTLVIIYGTADGQLWERRILDSGLLTDAHRVTDRKVVVNAVDSQQPGADAVSEGDGIHVLFIEESTRSIFSIRKDDAWGAEVLRIPAVNAAWVRGNIYTRPDGKSVYGYIYDAGSGGGSGMNRFAEILLD